MQPDIIMLSTDDYDHSQKVVVVKLSNPCHNPAAQERFRDLVRRTDENTYLEYYHGAVAITGDDHAMDVHDDLVAAHVSVTWL